MDKKKIISDVLFEFYDTNLASESARDWIADEIVKKLDNPEYKVRDVLQSEPTTKGIFEEYLSNRGVEKDAEERQKTFKEQLESNRLQKKDESEAETAKPVKSSKKTPSPKKPTRGRKPTKNLKNIRKPRGKFL